MSFLSIADILSSESAKIHEMKVINTEEIDQQFKYEEFIPYLRSFLAQDINSPTRQHYSIPTQNKVNATLLTMPAWKSGAYIGVKVINVFPDNINQPTIHGSYILSSGQTGENLAVFDGLSLTLKRTAAVCGLASLLLSRENIESMLMIGTGNLCTELIYAHSSVRDIKTIWVWGRNFQKAESKVEELKLQNVKIKAIETKDEILAIVDLISCATLSNTPLIHGSLLNGSTYIDLVGSYKPEMREADNETIRNANIFVDTKEAIHESGDLKIPLDTKVIDHKHILSDLPSLCKNPIQPSSLQNYKTIFKTVGFAAPDLAAAIYLYEKITHGEYI